MKNKGISLIVLIITCVVIIILATAIIVNIAQTNMIENAKEAVVKQDFTAMQDELNLYIADKYADTLGKYKPEELNVTEKDKVVEIIKSIKTTKYADYVVIEKGKIAVTDEIPEDMKELVNEILNTNSTAHVTHTYGEWETVVEATATTEGEKKKVCTVCGDEITTVIPMLGEIAKWNYNINEENKKVELVKYNGTDKNVTVYGNYEIDDVMYQTTIASNDYDEEAGVYIVPDYMFSSNTKIENVMFGKGIDMSNNIGLARMFYSCTALKNLDFINLDTSNVKSMRTMFYKCTSLKNIDVSNLDTSNVTTMRDMFAGCTLLESIDLTGLDTSNVTSMRTMFYECTSLKNIDISNLDTSNVTTMHAMFASCSSLISANLANLDTSNVTIMYGMFSDCTSLKNIDLTGMDTSKVTAMNFMFNHCEVLEKLDLSSFDTSNVTNMEQMFCACYKLTELKLSEKFNTSNVTKMTRMFCYCSALPELDLTSFDTRNTTLMNYLFEYCSKLKTIYVTKDKWSTSQADTYRMFASCGTSSVTYK